MLLVFRVSWDTDQPFEFVDVRYSPVLVSHFPISMA